MSRIKVLYIEDDDRQRRSFAETLRSTGFDVQAVASGKAGIQTMEKHRTDVILCDLNMPEMNGLDVLKQIKQIDAELPVIILTAHGTLDLAVKSLKLGAYDFVFKPLEIKNIETTIQKAIEKTKLEQELRQSQSSLQMLMENVPDIIYSLNSKGEFLSLNPAVEALLGYKPFEMLGTSVFKYIYSEDWERVKASFQQAMKCCDVSVKTMEFRMLTKTGEIRNFEVNRKLIFENGNVIRQDGIARDVTHRKQFKEELQKYSAELEMLIDERTNKLEYTTRQLAALNAVSNRFTQIYDEDALFEEVPVLLTHGLDFDRAILFIAKNGTLTLRSFCLEKDPPELVASFLKTIREKKGAMPPHLQESFQQNKTIFIPDLNADPRWPKAAGQLIRTKAVVVSPIKVKKKSIGVIVGNMQHHAREMDPQDVARFEMFVNMVGLALDNIRTYQSLERKVVERTKSLRNANRELRKKAKQLEKSTYAMAHANVELLSVQEQLEEKNAEMEHLLKALAESNRRLEALLDSSLSAIIMVDNENRVISANKRIQEFFGLQFKEILNKPIQLFSQKIKNCFADYNKLSQLVNELQRHPDPVYDEGIEIDKIYERSFKLIKPVERFVSVFSVPVLDKDNKELGKVWTYTDITKMKRADEQLRTIVEASPIPFIVSRQSDGRIFYANEPMAELIGLHKDELIGRFTPDFYFNPADRQIVVEKIKRDGYLHDYEVRIKKVDGSGRWMIFSIETAEVGGEAVFIGALYDINERKQAEEALRESEEKFRQLTENINEVFWIIDNQTKQLLYLSPAFEGISGHPRESVYNDPSAMFEAVHPEDITRVRAAFAKQIEQEQIEEYRIVRPDKSIRWIRERAFPVRNHKGEVYRICGVSEDFTERKLADEALKKERNFVSTVLDTAGALVVVLDPQGRIVRFNRACEQTTGYSFDEVKGKHIWDRFIIPAEVIRVRAIFAKLLAGDFPYYGENYWVTKTGEHRLIAWANTTLLDNKGNIEFIIGTGIDITDRKQAEEKLANRLRYEEGLAACSRTLLEGRDDHDALQEAIKHLLKAVDVDRVYIFENFADENDGLCIRQTHEVCAPGVKPEIENPLLQHLPYKEGLTRWRNKLSTGEPLQGLVETFPQEEKEVLEPQGILSILALPINVGAKWFGFIGFDDVKNKRNWNDEDIRLLQTAAEMIGGYIEHQQAEEALQESEERFRNLVENANDIIYSLTPEGKFTYVPPNWKDILGHEVSEVLGKSFEPFVHPEDLAACQKFLHKVFESGEKQSGIEYRVKHKNGSWRWHTSSASPFKDENGRVLYYIGIAHDITERKKFLDDLANANRHLRETQGQLVQSEKMASLGMLVAGIAHEINTPIGAVHSMHDTLKRAVKKLKQTLETQFPKEYQENHGLSTPIKIIDDANKVIENGSERVINIVRRLRSFARLDEAELKTVDIHEGLEDTLTLIHHEIKHNITVTKNFAELPAIACFPGRLNQVYLNLLINAKQAIRDKGEIAITTFQKEGNVHIEIQDNGVGISRDKLSRIFDPGFTTKGVGVGTGLGLSICYQIIKDHKGEIRVKSEVGKGSTFTIVFPMNLDELLENI